MTERTRVYVQWWMVLGGGTLLLLAYNSPWMRLYFRELQRFKLWVFGLAVEMNFGVWWSSMLFLLSALLFYEIASAAGGRLRRPYLQLSLLLLAVVIDEIGALHEWVSGIGGWAALAPFGLFGVLLLGDSLVRLWRQGEPRAVFWLVLAGFLVLASVAPQEYAEHNLTSRRWSDWYGRFIEEATELVGAGIILTAAVYRRTGRRWGGPMAAVVPDPSRFTGLIPIVSFGFLAHLVASQAELVEVGRWDGSMSAVYPTVVFFMLACYAFWMPFHRAEEGFPLPEVRGFWYGVGLFFLACSIGTMQNLWGFVGRVVPGLTRRWFYEKVPLYVALILVAWLIGLALWQRHRMRLLWLLALPLAMLVRLELRHPARKHLAAGLFALFCAWALMRTRGSGRAELAADSSDPPAARPPDRIEPRPTPRREERWKT